MDIFIVTNCLLNVLLMPPSIIGNIFVLVAILTTPSLRSPSILFLCSLAVSDLLVGLVVQPVYIAYQLNPEQGFKDAFDALSSLGCGVSLCTMTAISLDRFFALHYHLRYPNLMTNKRAICTSLTLWFLMFSASCLYVWNRTYARIAFVPAIAICFLVSTVLYIRVYQIVRRHQLLIHFQQQTVRNVSSDHNLNIARWKRSALNTFIYYIFMILCYFPMFTGMVVLTIHSRLQGQEWELTNTVLFMNSSINPILYCWRLRELRTAVLKIIRKLLRRHTEDN